MKTMFSTVVLATIFFVSCVHIFIFKDIRFTKHDSFTDFDLKLPTDIEQGLTGNNTGNDYFSMQITEANIETFSAELPEVMPDYRNPCWVEMVPEGFSYLDNTLYYQYYSLYPEHQPPGDWQNTYKRMETLIQARSKSRPDDRGWRLRCFPYFFLLGFTKSGTSDLRRALCKLPDFVPAIIKEPKFWNKVRLNQHLGADVLPPPTLSDYLDLYDEAAEALRHYVSVGQDVYHPGILGDFDPQTIWQLPTWLAIRGNEKRAEPQYITAHHIYGIRPQTKLIVLMRDPVERAFSHYRFFKGKKTGNRAINSDKFHDDMEKAITKLNTCFEEKSIKSCAYMNWKYDPSSMRSITVSMYHIYIEDWLNVFPRDQFLFLRSEDYFMDRIHVIHEILDFLGIDSKIPKSLIRKLEGLPVMNPSTKTGMGNHTRSLLQQFFKRGNQRLTSLLEDDKWLWDY